jgi:hypothetical protein
MPQDFDIHEWRLYQANLNLLNEDEDDDFNITTDAFDVIELRIGDIITPDMWNINSSYGKWFINNVDKNKNNWKIVYIGEHPEDDGEDDDNIWILIKNQSTGEKFSEVINYFNSYLKPKFSVNSLNESEEDDFNITLGDNWNVTELTVGDYIEPDMLKDPSDWTFPMEIVRFSNDGVDDTVWIKRILKKKGMFGREKEVEDIFEDLVYNWEKYDLKPYVKLVPPLNEQDEDDDFNITTDIFDEIELTIGDIINSSDMFEKPESYKFYFDSEPHIIKRIFRSDGEDTVDVSPVGGKRGEGWEMSLEGLNSLLKNKYRIIKPLKSLRELEDDDFNITLGDNWNEYEGDVNIKIVADVLWEDWHGNNLEEKWTLDKTINISELQEYSNNWGGFTGEVTDDNLHKWAAGVDVDLFNFGFDIGFDVDEINRDPEFEDKDEVIDTKLKFKISAVGLNESEDDDFNITLDDEWGVKELGVGDTIIGDMWDWKKIINTVNNEHRDDHAAIIRDIKRWHQIYDEGITINSIETNGDAHWIYFDSNFLNWGPGINWVNNLLSPGNRIVQSINEEEEDDFNITTDVFDIIELGVGDIITPDMFESPQEDELDAYYFRIISFQPNNKVYLRRIKYKLEDVYEIDDVNSLLKPKYQVVSPLNESDDDDFNVTLDDKWNEYDGDVEIIMKGPWGYNLVTYLENDDTGFIEDFEKLNPNITLDDYDMFVEYRTYKIKTNTGQLSNYYENWDDIPKGNIFTDVSIDGLVEWLGGDFDDIKRFIYSEAFYNNDFDKEVIDSKILYWENNLGNYLEIDWPPNYKPDDIIDEYFDEIDDDEIELINVKPLTINESEEDDFNITLGDEWGYEELTVGDYVKPEMWKEGTDLILKSKPLKIYEFGIDDEGDYVTFRRHNDTLISFDLDEINLDYLKPKYKIVLPLNEQDDNDFNITLGPEWEFEELTVGDIITPEMWDEEKISNVSTSIISDPDWFLSPHKITDYKKSYLDFIVFDNRKRLSTTFVRNFLKDSIKLDL